MELTPVVVWNYFFKITCIIGCSYQLQNVIWSYFSYGTVTKNKYSSPDAILYPQLHLCFRFLEDGFDWNAIEKKYSKQRKILRGHSDWLDVLTIRDIFDHTPNMTFDTCYYRDDTGHIVIRSNGTCSFFNVTKYIVQQYACYWMKPLKSDQMDFLFVHSSLYSERLLYQINYRGILSNYSRIRPTLTGKTYPYTSRKYVASYYKLPYDRTSLTLSCPMFKNDFLGYPYDKLPCPPNNDNVAYFKYIDTCLSNLTMKNIRRKPFYAFHTHPSDDSKLMSISQLYNESIRNSYTKWHKECQSMCPILPCKYAYCITTGKQQKKQEISGISKDVLTIRVETPLYPNISITYVPSLPFLDFIIYIFSSLGTWFGLVIISCNPVNLVEDVSNRSNVPNRLIHSRRDRSENIFLQQMIMRSR